MGRNAFMIGVLLIAVWYSVQPNRVIRLSPESPNSDFERVTNAAMTRPDLGVITNEERAKICRPYYYMNAHTDRIMQGDYDWTNARTVLGCDNAAEDVGFPPGGTYYWV